MRYVLLVLLAALVSCSKAPPERPQLRTQLAFPPVAEFTVPWDQQHDTKLYIMVFPDGMRCVKLSGKDTLSCLYPPVAPRTAVE